MYCIAGIVYSYIVLSNLFQSVSRSPNIFGRMPCCRISSRSIFTLPWQQQRRHQQQWETCALRLDSNTYPSQKNGLLCLIQSNCSWNGNYPSRSPSLHKSMQTHVWHLPQVICFNRTYVTLCATPDSPHVPLCSTRVLFSFVFHIYPNHMTLVGSGFLSSSRASLDQKSCKFQSAITLCKRVRPCKVCVSLCFTVLQQKSIQSCYGYGCRVRPSWVRTCRASKEESRGPGAHGNLLPKGAPGPKVYSVYQEAPLWIMYNYAWYSHYVSYNHEQVATQEKWHERPERMRKGIID